jgi:hypothetical protein
MEKAQIKGNLSSYPTRSLALVRGSIEDEEEAWTSKYIGKKY